MPIVQPYHPGFTAFLEGASQVAGDIGQTRRKYRDEDRDQQALEESLASSRQNRELNTDANTRANAREGRDAEYDALRNKRLQQAIDLEEEQPDVDLDEYDANTRDSLQGLEWERLPEELRNSIAGTRRQELAKAKGTKRKNLLRSFNDLNRRDLDAHLRESTLSGIGSALAQGRFAENPDAHENARLILNALHTGKDQKGNDVDPRHMHALWKQLDDSTREDEYQMATRASVLADIDSVIGMGMSRAALVTATKLRTDLKHHKITPEEAQDELDLITAGAYDTNDRGTGTGKQAEDPLLKARMQVLGHALSAGKDDPKLVKSLYQQGIALIGLGEEPEPDDGIPSLLRRPPGQTDGPAAASGGGAGADVPTPTATQEDVDEVGNLPEDVQEEARAFLLSGDMDGFNKFIDEYWSSGSVLDKKESKPTPLGGGAPVPGRFR